MNITISTKKGKLNIDFIHEFLTNSYWAKGRSRKDVLESIEHSLVFGVYKDDIQIGFARVLTDYTIFGYLMDVFIVEKYQGNGYGKQLIKTIMEHEKLRNIQKWMLATVDAHKLYKQFGFKEISDPSIFMSK
ncbi:GNAT family N-acetyltransferase [Flavobacteriaceae bacterium (ex Bugula neritina AB1)]|nr:GNAT family N-acetyltransferase [Flavobacteriaceae bacterium (ex Bugula neritina AB1)]